MQLHVYTTAEGFDALHEEWAALLAVNAIDEVFLTWEWQQLWWEAYQPGDLWLVAGRDDAGALIGIAPLYRERDSQIVRFVGGLDVTDYLDLLVTPTARDAFCTKLADWLRDQAAAFNSIGLCDIPALSANLHCLQHALETAGFAVEVVPHEVCPQITLPKTFEAHVEALDKKQRHELRRKLRRAEEGDGDKVDWYIVGQDDRVPAHNDFADQLECFLYLMSASHPDKAAFLKSPHHVTFFRTAMPQLYARGWVQLAFLTVNDEQVATYLSLDYGNRIGLYNSGLRPDIYSNLSTGIVLLAYIIRHAVEQGRTVFDFLRGNEEYKYRMGAHDTAVLELRATLPVISTEPAAGIEQSVRQVAGDL